MKAIMSGFEEIQHTADWAVKIWSVSPEGLFITALKAMYQLMDVSSNKTIETNFIIIELENQNLEGLSKISKEIKAVTFHNLNIDQQPSGLSAVLIFDV